MFWWRNVKRARGMSASWLQVEPLAWQPQPWGLASAVASGNGSLKRKADAALLDDAEAEALLDERARLWSAAHQFKA